MIPCANPLCGHDRDNHHGEFHSSGDVTNPASREKRYFNCLAMHCSCTKFVPETKEKK